MGRWIGWAVFQPPICHLHARIFLLPVRTVTTLRRLTKTAEALPPREVAIEQNERSQQFGENNQRKEERDPRPAQAPGRVDQEHDLPNPKGYWRKKSPPGPI